MNVIGPIRHWLRVVTLCPLLLLLLVPAVSRGQTQAPVAEPRGCGALLATPSLETLGAVLGPEAWPQAVGEAAAEVGPQKARLLETYSRRGFRPIFLDRDLRVSASGEEFFRRLDTLQDEAVEPAPFQVPEARRREKMLHGARDAVSALRVPQGGGGRCASPSDLARYVKETAGTPETRAAIEKHRELLRAGARLDALLAADLVLLAREMLPTAWAKAPVPEDVSALLKRMEPPAGPYATLRDTYRRYRDLASRLKVKRLPPEAKKLREGDSGENVRVLQERLKDEGWYAGPISGAFDGATREALMAFQRVHLLDPDGVMGERTRQWLNTSYDLKTRYIAWSMRGLRQSDARLHDRVVTINIPQYQMEYIVDGKVKSVNRVVVGQAGGKRIRMGERMIGENHTPAFESTIQRIAFNPRWYVSDRIRLELDGEEDKDPDYFDKHGYVELESTYPWGDPRIYQRPGPSNPLGVVKFEFPNPYAVFMHDTPKKRLFQRARRDFSHGCIRLEGALDFARLLLSEDANPAAATMDAALQKQDQVYVSLKKPVPIVIEYIPVSTDQGGNVVFGGDPYSWGEQFFTVISRK